MKRAKKQTISLLLVVLLVFGMSSMAFAVSTEDAVSAKGIIPTEYSGNDKDLPGFVTKLSSFKTLDKDEPNSELPSGITIDASTVDGKHLAWSSNKRISYVWVKSSNGGFLYDYTKNVPFIFDDSDLIGSFNDQGKIQDISHVTFFYDPDLPITGKLAIKKVMETGSADTSFEIKVTLLKGDEPTSIVYTADLAPDGTAEFDVGPGIYEVTETPKDGFEIAKVELGDVVLESPYRFTLGIAVNNDKLFIWDSTQVTVTNKDLSSPTPTPSTPPEVSPTPTPSTPPEVSPTPTPSIPPEVSPTPTPSTPPEVSPTPTPSTPPEVSPTPTPSIPPEVSPTPTPSTPPEVNPTPTPYTPPGGPRETDGPRATETPNPPPNPTPNPTPNTPPISPAATPEILVETPQPVPAAPATIASAAAPAEDAIPLEEEVPAGPAKLPKTGGTSPLFFYGIGSVIAGLGLMAGRKK